MKKLYDIVSHLSFITFFRRAAQAQRGVTFWWRAVLCLTLLAALFVGIVAWFTYDWATVEPVISSIPQNESIPVSVDELHNINDLYKKKENEYQMLLRTSPRAPSLGESVITSTAK